MNNMSERMAALKRMLEKEPGDLFLLYAIALEHKKLGNFADALKYLEEVLKKDAGYCVAYQQRGQVHELAGDVEAARRAYREGIQAAGRKGDQHAREEMEGALAMLE
jgi:tetratricopeptide (TPR) repeat protein